MEKTFPAGKHTQERTSICVCIFQFYTQNGQTNAGSRWDETHTMQLLWSCYPLLSEWAVICSHAV